MQSKWIATILLLAISSLAGCQQGRETGSSASERPSADGAKYLLPSQPEGATDVRAARETAADGDRVVVIGRIGGSENPWVEGRAAFSIVDRSLKACSDIPGDMCPKPWDYCCETLRLPSSTALVKVIGDDGSLVRSDARELLNVQELSTVVAEGQALRDDNGNLVVLASAVYVVQTERDP